MRNYHLLYKDGKCPFLSVGLRASIIFVILIAYTSLNGFAQELSEEIQKSEQHDLVAPLDAGDKNLTTDEDINKDIEATRVYMTPVSVLKEQQLTSSQPETTTKKELNPKLEEKDSNKTVKKP